MSSTITADVVVIGLGAFGSAVAWQLARRGVRVVGIDRFAPPHAMGSSHGESRITRLAVGEGAAYTPLVLRSHAIWRELEREGGEALFDEVGGLIMTSSDITARHHGKPDFVRGTIAVAEQYGLAHEVLDAAGIAARFPQFALRGDELGYYEPTAGLVAPERCIAAQLRLARRHGATLRTGETVLQCREAGGAVRVVTDRGVVEAARCVLTAGAWMPGLAAPLRPLARVHRQALHWFAPEDPAAYAPGRFPIFIWIHGHGETDYFYGFPASPEDGAVKVATETYLREDDPETADRNVMAGESRAMHAEHVAGRLRGITDRVARSAACLYTVTPDSGFIVDALPDQERILAISACSGHGFKHSAGLGEAVAQRLTGEAGVDLAPFAMGRFAA